MNIFRQYINLLESASNDPLGVVARIRELDTAFMTQYTERKKSADEANHDHRRGPFRPSLGAYDTRSHFHLSPCGRCHAPVWQQPCPVCGFYPMGDHDGGISMRSPEWQEKAELMRSKAKNVFIRKIQANGNIAAWYLNNKSNTVAFNTPEKFDRNVKPFVMDAMMEDWPGAEEIWNAYGPKSPDQ